MQEPGGAGSQPLADRPMATENRGNDPMRSMSMLQLLGGVAAAGVIAAGTTALTGSGVVRTGTAADQFVGGTVTQTITGATVTGVVYGYYDTNSQNQVNSIAITVAGASGKTLTITPGGGTFGGDAVAVADKWECTGGNVTPIRHISAPAVVLNADPDTITCVPVDSTNGNAATSRYYADLDTLDMAVA
ncbi:hypothetical protein ACIA5D_03610 [Actinoplanes sp. NPDC051513]|uniref:hypothetical protein n=1 Tax=Actinoplanes sp. NPDC051513 TaxID=3363908 RepID=UPI00378F37D1